MDMEVLEGIVDDLRSAIGKKEEGKNVVLNELSRAENISPVEQDPFKTEDEKKLALLDRAIRDGPRL